MVFGSLTVLFLDALVALTVELQKKRALPSFKRMREGMKLRCIIVGYIHGCDLKV